jgi:RNA polymerase sigma-70 factor (ECF subfamily)
MDDVKLVTRLQAGDVSALDTLMERHASRVYRLAYAITRNHADAEEVVQDVFLNVFRKIATFEGRAALGSWIYRVTANVALMRRRKRRLPRAEHDALQHVEGSATPEDYLLSRERRTLAARLLDGLPASYRAVVVLRDVEGLSTREAANAVGASLASVKCRLHRGRAWLRQQLAGDQISLDIAPTEGGRRLG